MQNMFDVPQNKEKSKSNKWQKFLRLDTLNETEFINNQKRQLGFLNSIAETLRGPKEDYKIRVSVGSGNSADAYESERSINVYGNK